MADIKIYGKLKAQTEEGMVTDADSIDDSNTSKTLVPAGYTEEEFVFTMKDGSTVRKKVLVKNVSS